MRYLLTKMYKKVLVTLSITALSAGLLVAAPVQAAETNTVGNVIAASEPTPATLNVCADNCDYTTIQAAINAASAGDTIQVSAGTYEEALAINKALTLLGPNALVSPNTGNPLVENDDRSAEAVLAPPTLANAHAITFPTGSYSGKIRIAGFTFDMAGTLEGQRFVSSSSAANLQLETEHNLFINGEYSVNGNWWLSGNSQSLKLTVVDNRFFNNESSNGIAPWNYGSGAATELTVTDNVWLDNKTWTMNAGSDNTTGTISNNWVGNSTPGTAGEDNWGYRQSGFLLTGVHNGLVVSNNTFKNLESAGIYFWGSNTTGAGFSGSATVTGNIFDGFSNAYSPDGAILVGQSANVSSVTISNNYFNSWTEGSVAVWYNVTSGSLDLSNNWWGDDSGPTYKPNIGGEGALVVRRAGTGVLDISPFCADDECATFVTPITYDVCDGDCSYTSIQAAIDAASADTTIRIAAGTYTENVALNKRVHLLGSGSTGATKTLIQGSLTVSASGNSELDPLLVQQLAVTNAAGDNLIISNGVANVRVAGVSSTGAGADGVEILGGTSTTQNLSFINSVVSSNTSTGFRMGGNVRLNGLVLDGVFVENNGSIGFSYNSSLTAISADNLVMEDVVFTNNAALAPIANNTGFGDISLFGFNGNASFTRVDVSAPNDANLSHVAFQIRGSNTAAPAGTIVLDDVSVTGYYARTGASAALGGYGLVVSNYTDVSNISFNDVTLDLELGHALAVWGLTNTLDIGDSVVRAKSVTNATIHIGASAVSQNNVFTRVDASDASLGGPDFAPVATATASNAQLFAMADRILDAVDIPSADAAKTGLVYFKPNTFVVTALSFLAGITETPSIQRGVNSALSGDTILVQAGTYAENLTISKSVSLIGPNTSVAALPVADWEANRGAEAIIGAANTTTRIAISGVVNVTISGFKFVSPSTGSGAQGITSSGGASGTISNNWFSSLANAADFSGADIYLQNGNSGSFIISGNYHEGSGAAQYGVADSGANGFSAMNPWYLDSVTIHGNRIENYGFSGMQIEGTKSSVITSNLVKNVSANGIQIANGASGTTVIRGNTVDGASLYYKSLFDTYLETGAVPINPEYCWAGIRLWNSNTSANNSIDVKNNLIKNIPARCGGIGLTGTASSVADEIQFNKFEDTQDGVLWINYTVQKYSVTNGVATLVLFTPSAWGSGYAVGSQVVVSGLGAPFDGTHTITAVGTEDVYGDNFLYRTLSFAVDNENVVPAFTDDEPATVVPLSRAESPFNFSRNYWGSSAGPNASGNSQNVGGAAVDTDSWIYSYTDGSAASGFINGVGFWPTNVLLSQVVQFTSTAPASGMVRDTYTASAVGGASGNAVVITSLTPTVCSVGSGNVVRFLLNGTCTIAANQSGSASFVAAEQVTQSISVLSPARVSTLSAPVLRVDGFSLTITNYNAAWTYTGVNSAGGTVVIDGSVVTVSGLAGNVTSTVTITSSRTGYVDGIATSAAATTPPPKVAKVPEFGEATPTGSGFTLSITNYDPLFSWTVTSSVEGASATLNPVTGVITVSGLDYEVSSNVLVTTSRTGFPGGSASSATVTTLKAPLTPTFGTPVSTNDGFSVAITNFDPTFNWAVTTTGNASASVNVETGTVVVTGEIPGRTTHFRLSTTKSGHVDGFADSSGTALNAARVSTFASPIRTMDGFTIQITNYNSAWTYAALSSVGGVATVSETGLVTVSGIARGVTSTVTVTTTREGYVTGSATSVEVTTPPANVALTPTFGTPQPTGDGFFLQITNFDPRFTWSATSSSGTVLFNAVAGWVLVSGLGYGGSASVTVETTRDLYPTGSATSSVVTALLAPLTPELGVPTQTTDGFTVQITNYEDNGWTWIPISSARGSSVSISGTGLVTVSGLRAGGSSTLTVATNKDGHVSSSAQVTSSAALAAFLPTFAKPVRISGGYRIQITNWRTGFGVTGVNSLGGTVTISNKGLITVTGLVRGSSSTVTITTTRNGYVTGVRTTAAAKAG